MTGRGGVYAAEDNMQGESELAYYECSARQFQ